MRAVKRRIRKRPMPLDVKIYVDLMVILGKAANDGFESLLVNVNKNDKK